ncbi:hypothetical protein [uncultured Flavobacterium sp.]|uniref:hypothetical protein n=1 Tax=uncultured Flavobacterium sp. TaxID=165435 RepID=UPI00292F1C40|nr:hypothetical protein [uncultured Flavobacterium sp.]
MVTIEEYKQEILALKDDDEKRIFTQKHYFHGNPAVFDNRENEYYYFRKRIADQFKIGFFEVLIVGSSKFGFSPYKFSKFSLNSDIDVVLFNEKLFDDFHNLISEYQYQIRNQKIRLNESQLKQHQKFIRYFVMGWMRPDLLPQNTSEFKELKENWDDFFKSISHSKSEVGNYIVKGGLFKSYYYAEKYYRSSIEEVSNKLSKL